MHKPGTAERSADPNRAVGLQKGKQEELQTAKAEPRIQRREQKIKPGTQT